MASGRTTARVAAFRHGGNYAADGGGVPQQLAGALWWGDYIGSALSAGVARIYHYQYEAEPLGLHARCETFGNYGMFVTDERYRILARAAQFYAAQMLTREWLAPGEAPQRIAPVATSLGRTDAVRRRRMRRAVPTARGRCSS